MRKGQLTLRAIELIFIAIVMALIGNMINEAYSSHRSVSDINYVLAASSFAAFTLVFYLIPANFSDDIYFHPAISTVVDTLTMLLLFAAAVALPSKLHADSCSNHNFLSSNSITRGAPSEEKRCREAQASSAFLWFAWFVFCLSLGTDIWEWARWGPSGTVRSAGGGVPGRRTQRPMSQV